MADITLTDSSHSSHLVEELRDLRSKGQLFDYVIKGTNLHFHSLVLALVSPVFRKMLYSGMGEAEKKEVIFSFIDDNSIIDNTEMGAQATREVTFPSIPDNIVTQIIDYAYNGTISISPDHLIDLAKAAHTLQMSKLQKLCEEQRRLGLRSVLIAGGQSASRTPNTASWILQDDDIVKFCDLNIALRGTGTSICEIPGGLMLTGGRGSDMCLTFVLTMKKCFKQRSLKASRYDHASCFNNGKVFLIGGVVAGSNTSSVDFMDLEKETWHTGPPLPKAATLLKLTAFKSATYVLDSKYCEFYELDATKMSWSTKASLPSPSYGCSLASSDDKVFAAGGDRNINYMYTPTTNEWCRLTGPSLQERQGALLYFQQKLFLFPGCNRDKNLVDVDEYDISADKWSRAKWKMPVPMALYGAFLVDVPK